MEGFISSYDMNTMMSTCVTCPEGSTYMDHDCKCDGENVK